MIEKIILDYLMDKLGVPVYAEQPIKKPSEYIVFKQIDGGRVNYINNASFYFESISTSMLNASKLNQAVINALYGLTEVENISSSKLGGTSQNIDTQSKRYAYECVFNLVYTED